MEKIKLMADYGCDPLWWASGGLVGNIDPMTLPISAELAADLIEWAGYFTSLLDFEDPANAGGFESMEEVERFVRAGEALAQRLEIELAGRYHVIYQPLPLEWDE